MKADLVSRTIRGLMAPNDHQEAATLSTGTTNDASVQIDLGACMLLPALRSDPRPTFVLDLESVNISFFNPALEARPNLYKTLVSATNDYGSLKDFAESSKRILLHGVEWDSYTIGGRWRVMSALSRSIDITDSKNVYTLERRTRGFALAAEGTDSTKLSAGLPKECEHFMSLFDWQSLGIGPISTWPRQLQRLFLGILVDPRPTCVYWGLDCIILYNEAFIPVLGDSKS